MLLLVVVVLARIVRDISVRIRIFAGRVITPVGQQIFGRHSVPRHIRRLHTSEGGERDICCFAVVAYRTVVREQIGLRAVEITVGIDLTQSSLDTPVAGELHLCTHHLAECVVHTAVELQPHVCTCAVVQHLLRR